MISNSLALLTLSPGWGVLLRWPPAAHAAASPFSFPSYLPPLLLLLLLPISCWPIWGTHPASLALPTI